ncbi:hypothetical protein Hrd1104_11390 [Halorhabdus sp. CBA1104]|uniref:hypothetical protein n=1 Tax=Halorhabdus sp. CBA1104 TaxID=1380432 RepID=UPI0012B39B89|nr:hypothetical protein [Halorhabdus sp. CBA1104]QGN07845.1 hypothetical protein Hrd1104_11390 [Halorhabdus sp. CBA1104]
MEAELVNYDDEEVAVLVTDEKGLDHQIAMDWSGAITYHGTDDYPHEPDDRTDDEQRIMCQVEERARYAAQQEFPEAAILDPMWDPEHLDAGLEALINYPLDRFHEQFRDFYEALADPAAFIEKPSINLEGVVVLKVFRFQGSEILDVAPVFVREVLNEREANDYGTFPNYPEDEQIVCAIPALEFEEGFTYEEDFHELVVEHVMAQIRDLYLHMGEEPPEEYLVQGVGKLDIHGDGIGET